MIPVSAKTDVALRLSAQRLYNHLAYTETATASVAYELSTRRTHLDHRAVVLAADRHELLSGLDALTHATPHPSLFTGTVMLGKTAFIFSGQGGQYSGMGKTLYESSHVFAAALDEACACLNRHLNQQLMDVIFSVAEAPQTKLLARTSYAQPALFALQVALFRLLEALGVHCDGVAGHSVGEIAAAHVAGVISLEDAARLAALRGQLMQSVSAYGAMAAISASEDEVFHSLTGLGHRVDVASVNSPRSVVISGDYDAVHEIAEHWANQGRRIRYLDVSHAFHSHHMDLVLDELGHLVEGIRFHLPRIPVYSSLTGDIAAPNQLHSPDYWVSQARRAVRFRDVADALLINGFRYFLELGPHPTLIPDLEQTVTAAQSGGDAVPRPVLVSGTLRRGVDDGRAILEVLARLHARGKSPDWPTIFADRQPNVALPTYPFQHEDFWRSLTSTNGNSLTGAQAPEHPFLDTAIDLPSGGWVFTGLIAVSRQPWLADHCVAGALVVSGTVFLDLAMHTGHHTGHPHLAELTLEAPLPLSERADVLLRVTIATPDDAGRHAINIYSHPAADAYADDVWTRHASGTLIDDMPSAATDPVEWPPSDANALVVNDVYEQLAELGYFYGPAYRGLDSAWRSGDSVYSRVSVPENLTSEDLHCRIHPALLDAATHAGIFLSADAPVNGQTLVPFSWRDVLVHPEAARSTTALARQTPTGTDTYSVELVSQTGMPLFTGTLALRAISAQALTAPPRDARDDLHLLAWRPFTTLAGRQDQAGKTRPRSFAVVGDDHLGIGTVLRRGGYDLRNYVDLSELNSALAPSTTTGTGGEGGNQSSAPLSQPALVFVYCPVTANAPAPAADAARATISETLRLVREWLDVDRQATDARLVLVTQGAITTGDDVPVRDLGQAAVWGLACSVQWEEPDRVAILDLDQQGAQLPSHIPLSVAIDALTQGENQVAVHSNTVLVPRLTTSELAPSLTPPANTSAWRLVSGTRRSLSDLALVAAPDAMAALEPGQVRVTVHAAGLNFKDVLLALGMVAGSDEITLGREIAGVVSEVGADVHDLQVGDTVMGLCQPALGTVAIVDHRLLVAIPPNWSFPEAASVCVAYLTAYIGLFDIAGLQARESVLIHAAAGGVGMAAVHLAQRVGAVVFATASHAKWDVLHAMGVPEAYIADSRDLRFEHELNAVVPQEGIHVVLNSLAGPFVDASLRLLSPGGRFVELGVRDVRDVAHVREDSDGVKYCPFGVPPISRISEILHDLHGLFTQGELPRLPLCTFDIREARSAFHYMREARHVGKIVLTMPRQRDPNGTVLITGGTGGIGRTLARHLAQAGVKHLLLISRNGLDVSEANCLQAALGDLGAETAIVACDVADRVALADLLTAIPKHRPLTSVIHAAGIVDDGLLHSLTPEQVDRVLRPKIDGAVNLHELTKDSGLAQFVLFSSSSSVFGSPGQSHYAAANAFLNALAQYRHHDGLPAISLAWGLWADRTGTTRHLTDTDHARIARAGLVPIQSDYGMKLFECALATAKPFIAPIPLERTVLRAQAADGEDLIPLLSEMFHRSSLRNSESTAARPASASLTTQWESLPAAKQQGFLREVVRDHAASVLGLGSSSVVEDETTFKDVGFDSLASVELRNRLAAATGMALPSTLIYDYSTPTALAAFLGQELAMTHSATAATSPADLDLLETTLASPADDPLLRVRVVALLRSALARWESPQPDTVRSESSAPDREDLLELLGTEFGIQR
ncbi:SDR family NAD(P)-dependent oxidoreductase [Mycobacteroides chelonae]